MWQTHPAVTPIESRPSLILSPCMKARMVTCFWPTGYGKGDRIVTPLIMLPYLRLCLSDWRERLSYGPWGSEQPMERATGTAARKAGQPLRAEGLCLADARNWILSAIMWAGGGPWAPERKTANFLSAAFETLSRGPNWAVPTLLTHGHCELTNGCWFKPLSLWSFVCSNQNWCMWLPQL